MRNDNKVLAKKTPAKKLKMAQIHITDIQYIEINSQDGLDFKYKPDVPKLKLVGNILNIENEDEDEEEYEFDDVFITEIPAGFEEESEWNIRIDSTSIYMDGSITFNGAIKHGSGEYWASVELEQLELLFI